MEKPPGIRPRVKNIVHAKSALIWRLDNSLFTATPDTCVHGTIRYMVQLGLVGGGSE